MASKERKVLIADAAIHPDGIKLLEEVAELTILPSYSPLEKLLEAVQDIEAILARTAVISAEVVRASPKLKIVSRHGVGVDSVDVTECTRQGVLVTITGDANSAAVSEQAFGMLLALASKLVPANALVKAGRWERERFVGVELGGKTLGLIGLGRIGSRMARQALAFDMAGLVYDPYVEAEQIRQVGATPVDLPTLLSQADFVSLHVPLTKETRHLIGRAELALMKPSAFLVNTARGGLIDEEALYEALVGDKLAGAALDVFEQEPLPANYPLAQLDNVLCSPHVAGQTAEALIKMSVGAADNILRVLRGEIPPFVVNRGALAHPKWTG
jgi:D-3-phosphoglycerate dehydrogenase